MARMSDPECWANQKMLSFLQRQRDRLLVLKDTVELIAWLAIPTGLSAGTLAIYWKSIDINMSVNIRLLALGILVVFFGLSVLCWFSREKDKQILGMKQEISSLKSRSPEVIEKIVEKTVYKEPAPSNQLDQDELTILKAMAAKGCGVYKDEMKRMCGAHQTKFDYYFHRLLIEFRLLEVQPSDGSRYTAYRLSQAGRAFAIKNKLIE